MAKYKMTINTDSYKCGRCSKKNWELGTRNDYMITINGITRTLYNMREVMEKLKANGVIRVPFKWLYDIRQYDKAMDGCYMEIVKVS